MSCSVGGDADVVLAALLPAMREKHSYKALYVDHFVALFDGHQVDLPEKVSLERYLAVPQVLVSVRGDATGMIDVPLRELGVTRTVQATLTRFSALPLVLRETRLLCNVPETSARYLAQAYGLQIRQLPVQSPEFTIGLAWQQALDRDPFTQWFIKLVESLLTELRPSACTRA
ncbi:LysR substrate-binding domain-containing protein [Pseudomonas aeruginosa]|uniref:LysR substrate-binding domain-containing protein n=1 Tax=Pseudomonas aeruginosa TaxID=287 RepID=UPI00280D3C23|nr:LysR substrate-binding domain-containing protein [Pseudomonas aeruginosa]MDQ9142368.1 LysR substrate-binding domain-containing protein [Pseudomonas aeruginosa]